MFLLSLNRVASLFRFAPAETWTLYRGDILPALERGFRFDLKVTSFIFLPLFAMALFSQFAPRIHLRHLKKVALYLWIPLLILIMIDHQYYAFFQSHINIIFFGIAEDDTLAVLKSVWTDHPLIRWLLLISFIYFCIYKVFHKYESHSHKFHLTKKRTYLSFAAFFPIYFMFMRGSFGPIPLRRDDATVSNHPFVNYLVLNPFFAIKEAIQEKSNSTSYVPEEKILSFYNESSVDSALNKLGKKSWDDIYSTSPKNADVEKTPPNVVYVMMESWSNFLIDYNSPTNNLLSSFDTHAKQDYLFRHTLSSMNSTLPAMEEMLLGKEVRDVFVWNSPFRFNSFPSALAQVYKNKGYRTLFITSGKLGWRNLSQWVPKQGFDESYGQNEILKEYSDALDCAWGVYDEYSFRLASDQLKKSKTPLFIFIMTTSNHTPYEVPPHFKAYPNKIPDDLNPTLTTSAELAQKSLVGYQYSNKSLGDFMTDVKSNTELKNKTVVMAVGDHNSWMLAARNSEVMSFAKTLSVPFYFYIPDYLKKNIYFDPKRAISHKDIISTLVPLTLSEAKYFNLGANIFDKNKSPNQFYALNSDSQPYKLLHTEDDDVHLMNQKAQAYLMINHIYFQREFCKMKASWCK